MKIQMESPAGLITVQTDERGSIVTRICFDGEPDDSEQDPGTTMRISGTVQTLVNWLLDYASGAPTAPTPVQALNLDACTPFEKRVYQAALEIPYGETTTYSEIAARIDEPKAARAVGQALARNPFLIVVPCHRVHAADGNLTGYAGGLTAKSALLAHEASHTH